MRICRLLAWLILTGLLLLLAGCFGGAGAPAPISADPQRQLPPNNPSPQVPPADSGETLPPANEFPDPEPGATDPEEEAPVEEPVPDPPGDNPGEPAPPPPPAEKPPAPGSVFSALSWDIVNRELTVGIGAHVSERLQVRVELPPEMMLDYWGYGWSYPYSESGDTTAEFEFRPGGGTEVLPVEYIRLVEPGYRSSIIVEASRWTGEDWALVEKTALAIELPEVQLTPEWRPAEGKLLLHGELLPKWRGLAEQTYSVYVSESLPGISVSPWYQSVTTPSFTAQWDVDIERSITRGGIVDVYLGGLKNSLPVYLPLIISGESYDNVTRELTVGIDNSTDPRREREVTVDCLLPDGTRLGAQAVRGGLGTAMFRMPDLGVDYLVTLEASDSAGNSDELQAYAGGWVSALPPDTIAAVPLQTTVNVGEPVRVVVAMGRPANPFHYMTGARIMVDAAAQPACVAESFNVGRPGGSVAEPDGGLWGRVLPSQGFLLAPDDWYAFVPDGTEGLLVLDFNLTPLEGRDTRLGGELFNFELTFGAPGSYRLLFGEPHIVNRTYYQDGNQTPDYLWGDQRNELPGLPNSVTVL